MSKRLIYGIDDRPPLRETLVLGFQHYLTMFGSTVAIPLLLAPAFGLEDDPVALGWLIGTMFFVSGVTTLLQTTFGNRLPLVQGGTFSFLTPAFAICGMAGLAEYQSFPPGNFRKWFRRSLQLGLRRQIKRYFMVLSGTPVWVPIPTSPILS